MKIEDIRSIIEDCGDILKWVAVILACGLVLVSCNIADGLQGAAQILREEPRP